MKSRLLAATVVALVWCTPALAAPANIELRIEGAATTTFEGPLTTDGKTIDKGGGQHPCDGTNAGAHAAPGPTATAALDDASIQAGFTWDGSWDAGFQDFLVNRIGPDAADLAGGKFWNFAVNFTPAQVGGCQQQVQAGDSVVFAYDSSCNCPPDYTKQFLALTGPGRAAVGRSLEVAVTDGETGAPVDGATVGGRLTAVDGKASLLFDSPGVRSFKAERADMVRSNALRVCVSTDGTGDCGVPAAQLGTPGASARGGARDSKAPDARISGPRDGARYRRGPRLLKGTATDDQSGVSLVKLALRRHVPGRNCRWWSGRRERFVGSHCRKVFFFAIGGDASWSYLLPRPLPPGRYVLDVKAFDRVRNRAELFQRGRNRVVFDVLER
jgi:hypothetical protein